LFAARFVRMKPFFLLLTLALSAMAGEYAVLTSGARLRIDRHELDGATVRLYNGSGTTEFPASLVARFEHDENSAAKPRASKASAAPTVGTQALIDEAARKYGLPKAFLHSVVKAESGYRADAVSPKGAVGLMQLMPGTAKTLGADASDPAQNVDAGARYLAELLLKYKGGVWHALAAYNAGPGAVQKYNGIPPYRETREYVDRIIKSWQKATK
jgi:soluble lytic murein transglycosylase-like protein